MLVIVSGSLLLYILLDHCSTIQLLSISGFACCCVRISPPLHPTGSLLHNTISGCACCCVRISPRLHPTGLLLHNTATELLRFCLLLCQDHPYVVFLCLCLDYISVFTVGVVLAFSNSQDCASSLSSLNLLVFVLNIWIKFLPKN